MEPARSLDSNVELFRFSVGSRPGDGDLNGVCVGLGRDVLEARVGMLNSPLPAPPGENLDGTVPARARRVCGRLSGVGSWVKSGNPSVGDSGIFSRRGVELPLVGGPPHGFTGIPETPSWAWISRARLENRRPVAAMSCEGEPEPDRGAPDILLEELRPGERPKGERTAPAD
jgi:hypothetical protein